jgi:hypothetical protein
MEIKHTVEILTKDIQDIEKLVRNFNNYTTPPLIELDLALEKLRNVYELLSMISFDVKSDQTIEKDLRNQTEQIRESKPQPVNNLPENEDNEKKEAQTPGKENQNTDEPKEEIENKKDIGDENEVVRKQQTEEVSPNEDQNKSEEVLPAEQKKASILAEKFAANKSLNEKIAPGKETESNSKFSGKSIDSIQRHIGINDRFLIIRELLAGNSEEYNILVQKLDTCSNFNDCFKLIETRFPDKLEHEGVKILVNLSRRRFISSGNV